VRITDAPWQAPVDIADHLGPLTTTTELNNPNSVVMIVTRSALPFGPAVADSVLRNLPSEILDAPFNRGLRCCRDRPGRLRLSALADHGPANRRGLFACLPESGPRGPPGWAAAMAGALVVAGGGHAQLVRKLADDLFRLIANLIGCLAPMRGSNYGRDHLRARGTDERS